MPSCFYELIYYLKIVYIPTALLICTENTSRAITKDRHFVELFKKSFTSYVEDGMSQLVETDIEILRNEEGVFLVTKDFKAKFYKFIVDHYLCKFQLIPFSLDTSNHCLCLNTARPGESRAPESEESDSGELWTITHVDRALELERRKKEKKYTTWLRKLMLKFRRRQGHDGA